MSKFFLSLLFVLPGIFSLTAYAQGDDPVIMKIGSETVRRSEFQRAYDRNKASGISPKDYAQLYITYRLKIAEALRLRIDTTRAFRDEFSSYRNDVLRKYVTDSAFEDSVVRSVYDRIKVQLKDSDILSVSHIFIRVPQRADAAARAAARASIDSVYRALKGGADFAETARKCSQDYVSAQRGGQLPEFGPGATLKEFEDKCYSMKPGELSEPFESTAGYHIVLIHSRHKLPPYEEKKADLVKALSQQGLQQAVFDHAVNEMVKKSGRLTREQVLDRIEKEHCANDSETRDLIRDYREGLLSYDVTKREVWDKAARDTAGIEKYFSRNRKKYAWDKPRYKGFVFHTKDESLIPQLREVLKRYGKNSWRQEVKARFTKDGKAEVNVSRGLWREGENSWVDKYVFHSPKASPQPLKSFPFSGVYGKLLKKGPENVYDVFSLVSGDYQDLKEKEWAESLRKNTETEIYSDVLDTVKEH